MSSGARRPGARLAPPPDKFIRCTFCNKPIAIGMTSHVVVLGRVNKRLNFCSRTCLESHLEIELGRRSGDSVILEA